MKSKLGLLPIIAALMGGLDSPFMGEKRNNIRPQDIDTTPKEKPIPKGCQRFSAPACCSSIQFRWLLRANWKEAAKPTSPCPCSNIRFDQRRGRYHEAAN